MAATTITRASLTDSTSPSTGDIWNAALVGTAIYDKVDALFTATVTFERSTSGDIAVISSNGSNTSGSDAALQAVVAGSSAGDPTVAFTITGIVTWTIGLDNTDSDQFKIAASTALGTSDIVVLNGLAHVFLNESADANVTTGISINQAGADDGILTFKSSDVAHGITTVIETDTYGYAAKADAAAGGLLWWGFSESTIGFNVKASATTADATRSTAGVAPIVCDSTLKSGTTIGSVGADKNLLVIRDNGTTRFIFDSDGDSHEDGTGWTAYDDFDDVALIASLEGELVSDPLRESFRRWMTYNRADLERARLVTFNADGRHFVNRSRMQMTVCGAIRQLALRLDALEGRT